jgi:cytosine/adenosine deaminase-related metal-dependent hydrolase
VWAKDEELERMKKGAIIHCPVSNRLLGNGVLDLKRVEKHDLPYTLATDGLSSNYSLNMYEELRAALFMHPYKEVTSFAKELIIKTTSFAQWLGFESGTLEPGKRADLQVVQVPEDLEVEDEIYLHLILHTKNPLAVYLKGVKYE